LREQLGKEVCTERAWRSSDLRRKNPGAQERLPREWPSAGTTGYDFLNALNSVFVDPKGAKCIEEVYDRFVGKKLVYEDLLYQKKSWSCLRCWESRCVPWVISWPCSLTRTVMLATCPEAIWTQALFETTAHMPIYRTYTRNLEVSREDAKNN